MSEGDIFSYIMDLKYSWWYYTCREEYRKGGVRVEIEARLRKMGLEITEAPKPLASYAPAIRVGDIVYTSGQLPLYEGKLTAQGKVEQDISLEEASGAAKICALNCLSAVKGLGINLEEIKRIIKVNGYVNSSPGFTGQPQVINGSSDFLIEVFGDQGIHARAAVGVSELPLNASVEIDMILELQTRGEKG